MNLFYFCTIFLSGNNAYSDPLIKLSLLRVESTSLQKEMEYVVWTPTAPPPKGGYPLLVMLHGLGDTATNWSRTSVPKTYTKALEEGLAPHIVIIPDGERGYWVDHMGSNLQYESWVLELIDIVEQQYPITEDLGFRTIMGLSMGAWGALSIGLRNPHEFGQMIAMSPTDVFIAAEKTPASPLYTIPFGDPVHAPFVSSKEPREWIMRGAGTEQRIALIYGSAEQDKFSKGAERLINTAKANDIDISVLVVDHGKHSWKSTWQPSSFLWWMRWLSDIQNP
ncbi:MAG: hypothetical protein CL916_15075 [Deltaproteobacteria bacterium]|nr:hypothetical protein [Deltaproteobacteria bacterium]